MLDGFVTLPLAARHLALLHAAMDDAVAAAWADKQAYKVARPSAADPSIEAALPVPASPSYPSDQPSELSGSAWLPLDRRRHRARQLVPDGPRPNARPRQGGG